MGILITWPVQRRRRAADGSPKGDAKILFFTGVRYVREVDESGSKAPVTAGLAGSGDIQALAVM